MNWEKIAMAVKRCLRLGGHTTSVIEVLNSVLTHVTVLWKNILQQNLQRIEIPTCNKIPTKVGRICH